MSKKKKNQTKVIRGREKTCDRKLKIKHTHTHTHYQIILTQNSIIKKNIMIHQPKVKLQKRINCIYIYI